jgi:intein/homing endonuclease
MTQPFVPNSYLSLSAQGVEALLPIQIDQNSDAYVEYSTTFYPAPASVKRTNLTEIQADGKKKKSLQRFTERSHYFELAQYLAEVNGYLQAVFAHLRYITTESQYGSMPDPSRDFGKGFRNLLALTNEEDIANSAKQFMEIANSGRMHILRPSVRMPGGFDVIYSGIPGVFPGKGSCLSVRTVADQYSLPELKSSGTYQHLAEHAYKTTFAELAIDKATKILQALMGEKTLAGTAVNAHLRHSNMLPLNFKFKSIIDKILNDLETRKVLGVTELADLSNFPQISAGLERGLGKYFSILVNIEPFREQVNYAYSTNATKGPDEETQPTSNEYLTLQPDITFSIVAHIPKDIAEYITQTPAGGKIPLVPLNTWASVWSRGLLRVPRARGAMSMKSVPRYVLPASATKSLNEARKTLGYHAETGRSNEDDMFVSNTGRLNYCPKSADLALDNANNYEKLLEEALEISFSAGTPLNTNQIGETHKCFSLAHPEYREKIGKIKQNVMKYAGCLQSYSWDYNCILSSAITDPTQLVAINLSGTTRPDELGISDYLKKPFAQSMAILFNQSSSDDTKRVSKDTFGGNGQATPMLKTTMFSNFFTLYQYLYQKQLVPSLQDLVTSAAKDMQISSLANTSAQQEEGSAVVYEFGIYHKVINLDLSLMPDFSSTGVSREAAFKLTAGMSSLLESALKDSYGAPQTNLARASARNGVDVVDDPHYFSPEHFTLAEFKNVYNYLGGRVFLGAMKAVQKVSKKDLFVIDASDSDVERVAIPNFGALVKEVMPMVYILGKYVVDSESIYEKADVIAQSNLRDTSISVDDIHPAGSKGPKGDDLGFQMFPHQVEANQYLRGTPPRFAILDIAPGGGKTTLLLSDIACLANEGLIKRPCVLAPNGLVKNWIEDMVKVTNGTWNMIPITTMTYRNWGDERLSEMIAKAPRNTVVVIGFSVTKLDPYPIVIGNHVEQVSNTLEFLKKFGFDYVAIDECLSGDSLIHTEKGLLRLDSVVPKMNIGEEAPLNIKVLTQAGTHETARAFKRRKEAFKIETHHGYSIKATSNHPIQILQKDLSLAWVNVEDLKEGDHVCVQRKHSLFPETPLKLLDIEGNPTSMSVDLARWLGFMVSEGHIGKYRVEFSNHNKHMLTDFEDISNRLFPKIVSNRTSGRVILNGKDTVEYLNYLGDQGLSGDKKIPWTIMQSTEEHIVAFLRALYEGDGGLDNLRITYSSKSKKLVKQLQVVLLNFGLISKIEHFTKEMPVSGTCTWYQLIIPSLYADTFKERIGFLTKRKSRLLSESAESYSRVTHDVIPFLNDYRMKLRNTYGFGNGVYSSRKGNMRLSILPTSAGVNYAATGYNATQEGYSYLKDEVSRGHVKLLSKKAHKTLKSIVESNFFFDPIVSIKSVGVKTVYDIEVPGPHSFVANGIVVHNCHKLKNAKSGIHRAIKQLCVSSSAKYIRLATGTLISNKLTDVVGQAAMFNSQIFRTAEEYEEENSEPAGENSKVMVWKENTPQLARQQLAKHCAVITFKRKEWAFMLPRPIEEIFYEGLSKPDSEGGNAHQLMYEAILTEKLDEIKNDKSIQKLLSGKDEDTEDEDKDEDGDSSKKKKNLSADRESSLVPPDDLDDATLAELEAQLNPYLARLEQLLTDPLNDPLLQVEGQEEYILPSDFVSNKVLKVIDRIRENFKDFPWVKGQSYKLKALADYDGIRYVLMGKKGERLTLASYEESYKSDISPNKDPRWQEESRGKVIVFCRFTRTVNAIYKQLPPDLKALAVKFHGEEKDKWANLNAFKTQPVSKDKGVQILIANEQAMTEGHNLQMASRLIRVEMPWAPGDLDQAAARIFRPDPSRKFKRETIYLDWVLTNNTIEVAKLGRLVSKMLSKTQFDEADNPLYDPLKEYKLPLIKMSLKTIGDMASINTIGEYLEAYGDMISIQSGEFEEMRQTKPSSMLAIEETTMFEDSGIIDHVPYIPDLEIMDKYDLGLIKLKAFLDDTDNLEAVDMVKDPKILIGRFVHTEFGDGVIVNVNQTKANVNSKAPRKISRVSVHLANGDLYESDISMIYLATNMSEADVKRFTPKSPWAKKGDKEKAAKLRAQAERQAAAESKKLDKQLAREKLLLAKLKSAESKVKPKRSDTKPLPPVNPVVELYPVIYNGFLALEATHEDPRDRTLDTYDYHEFGEYAYIKVPNADAFNAIVEYLDNKFDFSSDTITRLNSIRSVFKTGGKRDFDPILAPLSEFKNFYTLAHRVSGINKSTKMPIIRMYPVVRDGELMFNVDLSTNPAMRKYLNKRIAGTPVKFDDASSYHIKFFNKRVDLVRHVKELRADGVVISNYTDMVEQVREMNYKQGNI